MKHELNNSEGFLQENKFFKEIIEKITKRLNEIKYIGDIGDIGNEIGIAIKNHINEEKEGYELNSFFQGVKHGISLSDITEKHS